MIYGKVVDFFDLDFINFTLFGRSYDRWPVFNIADAAVTIGVLILVLFYKKHQDEDEKVENKTVEVVGLNENVSTQEISNINDNGSDITKEDQTNEQTDIRKEIPD